jgi:DNA-binding transcriptional LysR family regulator
MTLEQLRIFVAVAERRHMTRAAEALNLTQQAVSSVIVTLENAYSAVLFHLCILKTLSAWELCHWGIIG